MQELQALNVGTRIVVLGKRDVLGLGRYKGIGFSDHSLRWNAGA